MPAFSLSKPEQLRVMLVDNSPLMRDHVRGVLESVGIKHFVTACDGHRALDQIPAFDPHIAFVDWEMEPLCGLDFVRAVRDLPECDNPSVAIIMLASQAEAPWVIEAKNAGICEYLIKPATRAAILARLTSAINNPRSFVGSDNYFDPARRPAVGA